jgi:cystathionine beta-synthase
MEYLNHVSELIGKTPLIKLNSVTAGIKATVLAKVEYFNPGGSIKDRIATKLIDSAEEQGLLKPGGTIVEPTSGNTGIGLALIAQQRGYRCIFTLPDKVAEDKRNTLIAYGAELVVCPTAVSHEDPRSYYSVSDRLAEEIPGGFKPDQYSNLNGPAAHYASTGPEIWEATDGKVTHVVIGVGTGGTISGTGKYLKEVSGGRVEIIGCDPQGSIFSKSETHSQPYLVEGVGRGDDFLPGAFDASVVDRIIPIPDAESFDLTRRLAREEGLLVGPSCGMATVAALKVAKDLPGDAVVVVILPDGGRGYLAKVFNDDWMRSHGFLSDGSDTSVSDVVLSDPSGIPYVLENDSLESAQAALVASGLSSLPVMVKQPPVRIGHVIGTVSSAEIATAPTGATVAEILGPKPALVGALQSVDVAVDLLSKNDWVLLLEQGEVTALIGPDQLFVAPEHSTS